MNDFTKEELVEIVEMANDIERGSQAHGLQMHFKIRDKAQSMIDNYCEHTKIGFLGDVYGYECKDCGADINGHLITDEQHEASVRDVKCD